MLPQDICISYKDHVTNEKVCVKNQQAIRPHEDLLTIIKRRTARTILQSEKGEKTRQTDEQVGRQHQGMDRPGVHQVPDGSEEQGKMGETGCKIICGAPMTLTVKG